MPSKTKTSLAALFILGRSQWLFWRAPITGSMIVVQSARFRCPCPPVSPASSIMPRRYSRMRVEPSQFVEHRNKHRPREVFGTAG
jgi:hypothetical protein